MAVAVPVLYHGLAGTQGLVQGFGAGVLGEHGDVHVDVQVSSNALHELLLQGQVADQFGGPGLLLFHFQEVVWYVLGEEGVEDLLAQVTVVADHEVRFFAARDETGDTD